LWPRRGKQFRRLGRVVFHSDRKKRLMNSDLAIRLCFSLPYATERDILPDKVKIDQLRNVRRVDMPSVTPSGSTTFLKSPQKNERTLGGIIAFAVIVGVLFACLHLSLVQKKLGPHVYLVDLLGKALEGAALMFATATLFDGAKIRENGEASIESLKTIQQNMGETTDRLQGIGNALSTRYVGSFPGYLIQIKNLVRQSKSDLRIMCDFVGHGSFSDFSKWDEIQRELAQALKGKDSGRDEWENRREGRKLSLKVLCTSASTQRNLLGLQHRVFKNDEDWQLMIAERAYQAIAELVLNFEIPPNKVNGHSPRLIDQTRDEFIDRLIEQEDQIRSRLERGGADIKVVSTALPFYLWIQDEAEAVFAFPTHSEASSGENIASVATAFSTRDQGIVKSLILTFDRLRAEIVEQV